MTHIQPPRYASRRELAEKADWEGGVLDLIFDYGLSLDELPPDDLELRDLVARLLPLAPVVRRLEELLAEEPA